MQCFLVVYREYSTRDLIFLCIHIRLRLVCILSKIKSLVGYFTVYHLKAYYCIRLVCIALHVYKLNLRCTD